jgi:hypothetical protein
MRKQDVAKPDARIATGRKLRTDRKRINVKKYDYCTEFSVFGIFAAPEEFGRGLARSFFDSGTEYDP